MGLSGVSFTGCILAVIVASITPSKGNDRIVGGHPVDIREYPYQVALYANNKFLCGGSIIHEHLVITAAHCITLGQKYSIRVGSSSNNNGGEVYQIEDNNIIIHQLYNFPDSVDYDIALLRVNQSILSGNTVAKPIGLPFSGQQSPAGTPAKVSGWGSRVARPGPTNKCCRNDNDQLYAVVVPIVEQSVCQNKYGNQITDRMICAGYVDVGGKDACQGDSGGPMVVDNVLVGIVSWGYGCADPRYPGVYSNVANLRDWIKENGGI